MDIGADFFALVQLLVGAAIIVAAIWEKLVFPVLYKGSKRLFIWCSQYEAKSKAAEAIRKCDELLEQL